MISQKGIIVKFTITSFVCILTLLLVTAGCSGPTVDRSTWLISIGEDTLTVGTVGEAWNRMGDNQRELFLSKDNTIGEYIVTYGRKVLLEKELEFTGYLDNDSLLLFTSMWLNENLAEAGRRSLFNSVVENVSADEIDFFLGYLGRTVLFTENPGTENEQFSGPVHLPTLSREMIALIDTLPFGEMGTTESGIEIVVDSIMIADSALIAQALADTINARGNAANSIASARFEQMEVDLRESMIIDYNLSVDSTALRQLQLYYVQGSETPSLETVIIDSDLGSWTVFNLMDQVSYYQNRYSVDPADDNWIVVFTEVLHYNRYCRNIFEEEFPEKADSIVALSERNLLDMASELFYDDMIQSTVTVTVEDMQELFNSLEEPLTIPEKRVLQAVILPRDSQPAYRRMTPEEREQFHSSLPGFPYLSADTANPQITRPLTLDEVPAFHGEEIFLIDPSDTTTWLGPLDMYGGTQMCLFRLVDVIPERNALFEEVQDDLQIMTRNKLEEQTTIEVMQGLEEKYGIIINEEILDKLPEDPGTWAEL